MVVIEDVKIYDMAGNLLDGLGLPNISDAVLWIIAILGFSLSIGSWICTIATQRKSLSFVSVMYATYAKRHVFRMIIENKSQLPISINRIDLKTDIGWITCFHYSEMIHRVAVRQSNVVVHEEKYYNTAMPINLGSLDARSCLLLFRGDKANFQDLSTPASFRLYTNRGRVLETTLPFDTVENLRTVLRH